jgi:hypothetical protein
VLERGASAGTHFYSVRKRGLVGSTPNEGRGFRTLTRAPGRVFFTLSQVAAPVTAVLLDYCGFHSRARFSASAICCLLIPAATMFR